MNIGTFILVIILMLSWLSFCSLAGQLVTRLVNFPRLINGSSRTKNELAGEVKCLPSFCGWDFDWRTRNWTRHCKEIKWLSFWEQKEEHAKPDIFLKKVGGMKLDRNNYHRKVENNCHLSSRLKKSGQNYLSPNTRDELFNAGSITSRMLQPLISQEAPDDMQLVDIQSTPDNQSGRYTFNFWIQI